MTSVSKSSVTQSLSVQSRTGQDAPPPQPSGQPVTGFSPEDSSDCSPARKINVMAPLLVGDPKAPDSERSRAEFAAFEAMLREAKEAGVQAVSTDVWWGLVEPKDGTFDFSHYDRIADAIERAGLKWTPILSFHQCGGNVGDSVDIPIPSYLRQKYARLSSDGEASAFCKSEQGNVCYEAISPFASEFALKDYRALMEAFLEHFAPRSKNISEVNISLGPAGELRYPSYNSHDKGTDYPSRGALQSYSTLAKNSFREFVLDRYSTLEEAGEAWNTKLSDTKDIRPPDDAQAFFDRGDDKHTTYGRDFFDWYHQTLLDHGARLVETAQSVFHRKDSAFSSIPLGAKCAGVHWRIGSDRAAELAAGLIPSRALTPGRLPGSEYDSLVKQFAALDARTETPLILHFTCLEKADKGDERPASLVRWVGESATRHGVPLSGENALPMSYEGPDGWNRVEDALERLYDGITILRLPLADSAKAGLHGLTRRYIDACDAGVRSALTGDRSP